MFQPQAHQGRTTTPLATGPGHKTRLDGTMADSSTRHNDQLPRPPPIIQSVIFMTPTPSVSMVTDFFSYIICIPKTLREPGLSVIAHLCLWDFQLSKKPTFYAVKHAHISSLA